MKIFIIFLSVFVVVCVISTVYIVYSFFFASSSKKVYIVDADEFEKQLKANNDEQLIDVRTPWEFKKKRIKGAINTEYPSVSFSTKIVALDKAKPVFVYCHSGYRSKMVIPILCKAGFKTIFELGDGFTSWVKAGKSVVY